MLLGLLAAVMLLAICSAWSVCRQSKRTSLLHEASTAVRLLVVRFVLVPKVLLCREARLDWHNVQRLRASSRDGIMRDVVAALVIDTNTHVELVFK